MNGFFALAILAFLAALLVPTGAVELLLLCASAFCCGKGLSVALNNAVDQASR